MQEHNDKRALHEMYMHWFKEHIVPTEWWEDKQDEFEIIFSDKRWEWEDAINPTLAGCPHGCLRFYNESNNRRRPRPSLFHVFLDRSQAVRKPVVNDIEVLVAEYGVFPTNVADNVCTE